MWDTVDAVGLPIDELCTVLYRFVYPYKFPDQVPSDHIRYACHALAIDDKRHTFHPLLWDEKGTTHSSRIKQVWFTGMHANVGGGYPDDDLAHVSLDWMIKEAQKHGLKFIPEQVDRIKQRADPMGKLYDSRRGAARYYRYKPRRIHDLCNDAERGVQVDEPKIHLSVVDRIRQESVGYSPSGLPDNARLVDYTGNETSLNPPVIAPPGADLHAHRVEMLERAQDHIWWGRVAYFGLLFLTLGLVTLPHFLPSIPGKLSSGGLESFYTWVFNVISSFLPAFLRYWTDAWTQAPTVFTVFLLLIAGLLVWSSYINGKIQTMAESGWWHVKALPQSTRYDKPPKWAERLAHYIRTQSSIKGLYWILTRHIVPIGFLLLCLYLLYGLTYRLLVHYPLVNAGICGLEHAQVYSPEVSRDKRSVTIDFNTRTPCHNTGFLIEAGATYTIEINPNSNWRDSNVDVGIDGFDNKWNFLSLRYLAGLPARRHLSLPWFSLIGEIGTDSGNIVPFKERSFTFKSRYRGVLHLYVNDAINAWGIQVPGKQSEGRGKNSTWDAFYRNNYGSASIKISRRD